MAKRFTDTKKWGHPSFQPLPVKAKLTWLYLLDECDHAGIVLMNYAIAEVQLGFPISLEQIASWFGDKVYQAGDKRLFIPDFVRFQYSVRRNDDFNPASKPHLAVLREFENFGVSLDFPGDSLNKVFSSHDLIASDTLSIPLGKGSLTLQDKDKDKDKDIKGGAGGKFDFDSLYAKYPKKEGKPAGLIQCRKQIKTQADYDALSQAIDRYAAQRAKDGWEIKMFSSFMGSEKTGHPWREWCNPETGSTIPGAQKKSAADAWLEEQQAKQGGGAA
jgi:hypothetical protein